MTIPSRPVRKLIGKIEHEQISQGNQLATRADRCLYGWDGLSFAFPSVCKRLLRSISDPNVPQPLFSGLDTVRRCHRIPLSAEAIPA